MSIFLTSDCHFNHDREFIWRARGFDSVQEMNETIVSNWNATVSADDEVYLLGDVMLGKDDSIEYLKRLNGKIHIILGNHDTSKRTKMYHNCDNVVSVSYAEMIKHGKYHIYLSHFPTITTNGETRGLSQVTLNMYGHTHQTDNFYDEIPWLYHVGMDSHNCYPIQLEDAINDMKIKMYEYKTAHGFFEN